MWMLKDRLRLALLDQARAAAVITYRDLADRLELRPPQTIHRVTQALEILMAEDVAAHRPLLAALCVSRAQGDLPAPGFFAAARALGIYAGDLEGPQAQAFYADALARALEFYRQVPDETFAR
jgi:hypothetical protein